MYMENGAAIVVEVLSDVTEDGWRVAKLRALRVDRQPVMGHADPGDEWTSRRKLGAGAWAGMWSLEPMTEAEVETGEVSDAQ
jgi:hypothetical protein